MRGSIAEGLEAAVKNVKDNLKIYPLSQKDDPPEWNLSGAPNKHSTPFMPTTSIFTRKSMP
jgi:hypothetical protein